MAAGGARSIYRNINTQYPDTNQANCIAVGPIVDSAYYSRADKHQLREKLGIDANTNPV